jgi:tetratricopeptide (TPR) repeat protein
MEELAEYDPDLFIVYTGQNEFLEQRTYEGLLATPGPIREAMAFLGRTRTCTLVREIVGASDGDSTTVLPVDPKGIPVDSVGPDAYRRDDRFRRQVLHHLRVNLDRMVDIAEAAGAGIVFVTPASNLVDFSPFRSDPGEDVDRADRARFERLLARGTALAEAGEAPRAVEVLTEAVAIDERHAEAQYRLGRALLAAGREEEAMRHLEKARDEDICPMRAVTDVISTIREVAAERGAGLVPFDRFAPRDMSGFYDHVHLSLDATCLLAGELARTLTGKGIDDEVAGRVDRRRRAARDHARDAAQLRLLARMLVWLKEPALATRAAREAKDLDPENAESEALIGSLVLERDPDLAKRHFERALELDPGSASTHFHLGVLLEKEDDLEGAERHLRAAVEAEPEYRPAWKRRAIVLMKRGRVNEAVRCFERVVSLDPEDANGRSDLGLAYARQGEPTKALEEYAHALRLDPKHPPAHFNRGILHASRGERAAAIEDFRAVLETIPGHVEARRRLLELGGKVPE